MILPHGRLKYLMLLEIMPWLFFKAPRVPPVTFPFGRIMNFITCQAFHPLMPIWFWMATVNPFYCFYDRGTNEGNMAKERFFLQRMLTLFTNMRLLMRFIIK